mmetsp:Transcript_135402/g.191594  ORF Transcript_135402/g.191594 Transcript_135402/m.191594 type:complete len:185 (-) Transcript_135402:69-623(-)
MTMYPPLEITVNDAASSTSSFEKPRMEKDNKQEMVQRSERRPSTLPGKMISFSKRVKIKKIRSYKLYSDHERDSVWHNEDEYAAIKRGCIVTLKKMMKDGFQENEDFCPRGLEVRTREASAARKEIRALAAQLVFDEQDIQADLGLMNEERIREAYLDISRDAQERAHFNAVRDQRAVKEYLSR